MKHALESTQKSRLAFTYLCKDLTIEQLNKIPEGFNNNIVWNFGHVIVTQQSLCYGLSGLPLNVSMEMVEKYRKGSKPTEFISMEEYKKLQKLSEKLLEQFEKDYEDGIFVSYKPYMTSLNVELDSVQKAISFNAFHEGLHFGTMLALKKLV